MPHLLPGEAAVVFHTFDEACRLVREAVQRKELAPIYKAYKEWQKSHPKFPSNPNTMYAGQWIDMRHFLTGEAAVVFHTFDEACRLVREAVEREELAPAWAAYKKWQKSRPKFPSNPNATYAGQWIDLRHFLTGEAAVSHTFDEACRLAREAVQSGELAPTAAAYNEWQKSRPKFPSNPSKKYAGQWIDWSHFLTGEAAVAFHTFDEACRLVREAVQREELAPTYAAYKEWRKSHPKFPSNPKTTYAGQWIDWSHFLVNLPRNVARWVHVRLGKTAGELAAVSCDVVDAHLETLRSIHARLRTTVARELPFGRKPLSLARLKRHYHSQLVQLVETEAKKAAKQAQANAKTAAKMAVRVAAKAIRAAAKAQATVGKATAKAQATASKATAKAVKMAGRVAAMAERAAAKARAKASKAAAKAQAKASKAVAKAQAKAKQAAAKAKKAAAKAKKAAAKAKKAAEAKKAVETKTKRKPDASRTKKRKGEYAPGDESGSSEGREIKRHAAASDDGNAPRSVLAVLSPSAAEALAVRAAQAALRPSVAEVLAARAAQLAAQAAAQATAQRQHAAASDDGNAPCSVLSVLSPAAARAAVQQCIAQVAARVAAQAAAAATYYRLYAWQCATAAAERAGTLPCAMPWVVAASAAQVAAQAAAQAAACSVTTVAYCRQYVSQYQYATAASAPRTARKRKLVCAPGCECAGCLPGDGAPPPLVKRQLPPCAPDCEECPACLTDDDEAPPPPRKKQRAPPPFEALSPSAVEALARRAYAERHRAPATYGAAHDDPHRRFKADTNAAFVAAVGPVGGVLVLDDDAHPAFGTSTALRGRYPDIAVRLHVPQCDEDKAERMKTHPDFPDFGARVTHEEGGAALRRLLASGLRAAYYDSCQHLATVVRALEGLRFPPGFVLGVTWIEDRFSGPTPPGPLFALLSAAGSYECVAHLMYDGGSNKVNTLIARYR